MCSSDLVLVESIIQDHDCTVVLVGRTDISACPSYIEKMADKEFEDYESEFYKTQFQKKPSVSILDHKKKYGAYRSIREIKRNIASLKEYAGTVEYMNCDVKDPEEVHKLIKSVIDRFGKIDLVIHGSGIQTSKLFAKKQESEFFDIIETKVKGANNLISSLESCNGGHKTHLHLVSSSFSFLGNAGQPDYGAANEWFNRKAGCSNADSLIECSSLGWLGWDGVGMTQGNEYSVLMDNKGLHKLTVQEGLYLFKEFLDCYKDSPNQLVLSSKEIQIYDLFSSIKGSGRYMKTFQVSPEKYPYLLHHRVNNVPTVPGMLELDWIVDTFISESKSTAGVFCLEDCKFLKFLKINTEREVRCCLKDHGDHWRADITSDFVHSSGKVLQPNIRHVSANLRVANKFPGAIKEDSLFIKNGTLIRDPYTLEDSPVKLSGPFKCLENIMVGEKFQLARIELNKSGTQNNTIPVVLLDAVLRLSAINMDTNGDVSTYIPDSIGKLWLLRDYMSYIPPNKVITVKVTKPRVDKDKVFNDKVIVFAESKPIIIFENIIGLKYYRSKISL